MRSVPFGIVQILLEKLCADDLVGDTMSVVNVAFYGSDDLARELAKKSDSRDIDSYVFKDTSSGPTRILSLLRPLKHPDSIRPLLSVLNVSRVGFIEVSKIDSSLGEVLVAMKCSGIESGIAIITQDTESWVDPDQVRLIFQQVELEWEILENTPEPHELREKFFSLHTEKDGDDSLLVPIDQKFNVQGIGVVGIGYVQSGTIKRHDQIEIIPGGKTGVVRSLQVMDDDVEDASSGDRVGVALRGVDESSLAKGSLIVHQGSESLSEVLSSTYKLRKSKFQKRSLSINDVVHASTNLQFKVGRIVGMEGEMITIDWESPLVIRKDSDEAVVIVQLDAVPMRVIGAITESSSA